MVHITVWCINSCFYKCFSFRSPSLNDIFRISSQILYSSTCLYMIFLKFSISLQYSKKYFMTKVKIRGLCYTLDFSLHNLIIQHPSSCLSYHKLSKLRSEAMLIILSLMLTNLTIMTPLTLQAPFYQYSPLLSQPPKMSIDTNSGPTRSPLSSRIRLPAQRQVLIQK